MRGKSNVSDVSFLLNHMFLTFSHIEGSIFLLEGSVLCSGPEESKAKVLHCNIMETGRGQ